MKSQMINKDDFQKLKDKIERWDMRPIANEGWTAELMDENDPDGGVVIKNEKGQMKYMMPLDVYEELMAEKANEHE